jgi:hypothetical protein
VVLTSFFPSFHHPLSFLPLLLLSQFPHVSLSPPLLPFFPSCFFTSEMVRESLQWGPIYLRWEWPHTCTCTHTCIHIIFRDDTLCTCSTLK